MGLVNKSGRYSAGDLLAAIVKVVSSTVRSSPTKTMSVRLPMDLVDQTVTRARMSGQTSSEYIADCLAGRALTEYPFLAALGELIAIRALVLTCNYGVDTDARLVEVLKLVRDAARAELSK